MSIVTRIARLIITVTVVALFFGCTKELEMATQDAAKTQEHVAASKHLRRVMHDMNNVLYEHHKSELERDQQRERYAFKLADKVGAISQEIKKYPEESGKEYFKNPEKKGYFMTLVDQLDVHGKNIKGIASNDNKKALNEEIKNMIQTCNQCHAQFNPNGPKIQ